MKLVEVIQTEHSRKDVIEIMMNLARQMGKTPVFVRMRPDLL